MSFGQIVLCAARTHSFGLHLILGNLVLGLWLEVHAFPSNYTASLDRFESHAGPIIVPQLKCSSIPLLGESGQPDLSRFRVYSAALLPSQQEFPASWHCLITARHHRSELFDGPPW